MSVDNINYTYINLYTIFPTCPRENYAIAAHGNTATISHLFQDVPRRLLRSQLQSLLIVARIQMANDQEIIGRPQLTADRLQLLTKTATHSLKKEKQRS